MNLLQVAADLARDEDGQKVIDGQVLSEVLGGDLRRFDKGGDLFYEQISAMHKSVRGSSPDGALYWMARMLDGGCDPLYIARRVVRMASEDIGNADPRALSLALAAWDTQERLGSRKGNWLLPRQLPIWLARLKATLCIMALIRPWPMCAGTRPMTCLCIFAMRQLP